MSNVNCIFGCKDYFLQAIQVCCIPAGSWLVLGVARNKIEDCVV